jgi:hypothetical protein
LPAALHATPISLSAATASQPDGEISRITGLPDSSDETGIGFSFAETNSQFDTDPPI